MKTAINFPVKDASSRSSSRRGWRREKEGEEDKGRERESEGKREREGRGRESEPQGLEQLSRTYRSHMHSPQYRIVGSSTCIPCPLLGSAICRRGGGSLAAL